VSRITSRPSPWARPDLTPGVTAAVLLGGLISLVAGVWGFFAPESFAAFVAFPYHEHFLHDVGAFQIGFGATMLLALLWADSVMVVLGGYIIGSGFHLVSHIIDRDVGGHSSDAPGIAILVIIGLAGMVARIRGNSDARD
jgi:hypothetical protein